MKTPKLFCIFLLIFAFTNSIFAQSSPTESKEEKDKAQKESEKKAVALLEQVVGETGLLKFPDNRALILASAADLLWQRDEKRARQLFRQAANEIVQANNMPKDDSMPGFIGIFQNSSPRKQILTTIAKYDADLALELLYATRESPLTSLRRSENDKFFLPARISINLLSRKSADFAQVLQPQPSRVWLQNLRLFAQRRFCSWKIRKNYCNW